MKKVREAEGREKTEVINQRITKQTLQTIPGWLLTRQSVLASKHKDDDLQRDPKAAAPTDGTPKTPGWLWLWSDQWSGFRDYDTDDSLLRTWHNEHRHCGQGQCGKDFFLFFKEKILILLFNCWRKTSLLCWDLGDDNLESSEWLNFPNGPANCFPNAANNMRKMACGKHYKPVPFLKRKSGPYITTEGRTTKIFHCGRTAEQTAALIQLWARAVGSRAKEREREREKEGRVGK